MATQLHLFQNSVLLTTMLTAPIAVSAAPSSLKVTTGIDISSGDYGETEDTDIVYLPLTFKFSSQPWIFKLTLPYLSIKGPSSLVGGIDGAEVVNSGSDEIRSSTGMGDIVLSAAFALDSLWVTDAYIDLITKVKLPTARESEGLGTGEADFQLQLEIAKIYGRYTPFATLGYKLPGNSSDTSYDNQILASIGVDVKTNDQTSVGALYDYREASSNTSSIRSEALAYVNRKINKRFSVNTYVITGFSDNSPDLGAGVQFSWLVD